MHSFDRTMLARLGFNDPDKKDRRHDYACQYVSLPEIAEAIAGEVFKRQVANGKSTLRTYSESFENGAVNEAAFAKLVAIYLKSEAIGFADVRFLESAQEFHLQKGEGKYATTVGFIDAILKFQASGLIHTCIPRHIFSSYCGCFDADELSRVRDKAILFKHSPCFNISVVVEVKINEVSVGDIVRQINLYRSYLRPAIHSVDSAGIVVVCAFSLQEADIATLHQAGVHYMRLGSKFDAYVSRRETGGNQPSSPVVEL